VTASRTRDLLCWIRPQKVTKPPIHRSLTDAPERVALREIGDTFVLPD